MSQNSPSPSELTDAYRINPYGAVLELERATETLADGVESEDADAINNALETFEKRLPDLKTAVRVRYSGNTDWIPFHVDGQYVSEYDSDDSRRTRKRDLATADIPTEGETQ